MWQEEDNNISSSTTFFSSTFPPSAASSSPIPSTPSFFPSAQPEPSSPRPSATLPSSALPSTIASRPAAYTIGTKSHSYSNDRLPRHRSSVASLASLASLSSDLPLDGFSSASSLPSETMPPTPDTDLDSNPLSSTGLDSATTSTTVASTANSPTTLTKKSLHRASSLQRLNHESDGPLLPSAGAAQSRQSSLSLNLNLNRHGSLSRKGSGTRQDRESGSKHVMLNRRSTSQDLQLRLSQQRQEDLAEEADELGEDQVPGTPSSVSSFGSGTVDRVRVSRPSAGSSRNSVALIESRNIQTLSSNLAMANSPTDSDFPNNNSDALLSVIAQKEARIAQLREDLDSNLAELALLKERWSTIMLQERNRQQAEASASIQQQEQQLYGHSSSQSVSHRLSTTGAGLWGTVVGSVSGISGVSGGISLHHINTLHHQQHQHQPSSPMSPAHHHPSTPTSSSSSNFPQGPGRTSTSSYSSRGDHSTVPGSSRPTSPLPAYLSGYSSLNGLHANPANTSSPLPGSSSRRGDRASLSSLSTCSSSRSNSGEGPTAFEAGHSSQSSFSSAGHPDQSAAQLQSHKEHRDSRRMKRESSGLFIPPEAEEVLVNTGRALFKGFGSLLGGIRTVVNDVAESDRFQHSRQRTMDMVSGLAQTAADALPLPSHDDIYYHHQRLRLLDEEDESSVEPQPMMTEQQRQIQLQQLQQAKEQRRRERIKEKERRLQEKASSTGALEEEPAGAESQSRSSSATQLVRRTSRPKKSTPSTPSQETLTRSGSVKKEGTTLSHQVSQLSIRSESNGSSYSKGRVAHATQVEPSAEMDETVEGWGADDKELLASLQAQVLDQEKASLAEEQGAPIALLSKKHD